MHLHIQNFDGLGDVFEITPSRLEQALARHPDVAADTTITVGNDRQSFKKEMQTAQALFAWDFDHSQLSKIAPNLRHHHQQPWRARQ